METNTTEKEVEEKEAYSSFLGGIFESQPSPLGHVYGLCSWVFEFLFYNFFQWNTAKLHQFLKVNSVKFVTADTKVKHNNNSKMGTVAFVDEQAIKLWVDLQSKFHCPLLSCRRCKKLHFKTTYNPFFQGRSFITLQFETLEFCLGDWTGDKVFGRHPSMSEIFKNEPTVVFFAGGPQKLTFQIASYTFSYKFPVRLSFCLFFSL
jgi:hypothetical protein